MLYQYLHLLEFLVKIEDLTNQYQVINIAVSDHIPILIIIHPFVNT